MANPSFVDTFWSNFNDSEVYVEVLCDKTDNLIDEIISSYSLVAPVNSSKGGNLDNLDIKRMDVLSLINISLLEGSIAEESLMELVVNEEGDFDIITIGTMGGLDDCDIYYTFQTQSFTENCQGVMLTGGAPLIERPPLVWKSVFGDGVENKQVHDYTQIATNCNLDNFSTHAIIVYDDPHTTDSAFMDGVDNMYELTLANAYEKIVGWVYAMNAPNKTVDTTIKHSKTAIIPIMVTGNKGDWNSADLGSLVKRPSYAEDDSGGNSGCYSSDQGKEVGKEAEGVLIPLDDKLFYTDKNGQTLSKFIKVQAVYVIGYQFDSLYSIPKTNTAGATKDLTQEGNLVVGSIVNTNKNTIKLEEGVNYAIKYAVSDANGFKVPSIIFANNARPADPVDYGSNTPFQLLPYCPMAQNLEFGTGINVGTLLPVANTRGFLVEQVVAMIEIDTPSIAIYDPEFNYSYDSTNDSKANDIANALQYEVAPMIIIEKPAPIVIASNDITEIIDQSASIQDSDPFTLQAFVDSPLEKALDAMSNGPGVTATLSFIQDEEDLLSLAKNIFSFMNAGDTTITTYMCGPESEPKLGYLGNDGGIINEITYSYADSSSYTISVNEGPWMVKDIVSVNTGISFKVTEDATARATIVEDLGNHIHYKVRIDGHGDRVAVNTIPTILRVGDVISVTIHNNPVEE